MKTEEYKIKEFLPKGYNVILIDNNPDKGVITIHYKKEELSHLPDDYVDNIKIITPQDIIRLGHKYDCIFTNGKIIEDLLRLEKIDKKNESKSPSEENNFKWYVEEEKIKKYMPEK
jgi:hypothetical protein